MSMEVNELRGEKFLGRGESEIDSPLFNPKMKIPFCWLLFTHALHREKNTLETKPECYANDKVKSPPVFRSLYDDF